MKQQYKIIITLAFAIIIIAALFSLFGFFMDRLSTRFEELTITALSERDQSMPENISYSDGQKIYVPAYSYLPVSPEENFDLKILLSIRNTDPGNIISITRVDYYDTQGKLQRQFIEEPQSLNPLETKEFLIEQADPTGGSGANFFITWESDSTSFEPVVEALMYGTNGPNSFDFKSQGLIIKDE